MSSRTPASVSHPLLMERISRYPMPRIPGSEASYPIARSFLTSPRIPSENIRSTLSSIRRYSSSRSRCSPRMRNWKSSRGVRGHRKEYTDSPVDSSTLEGSGDPVGITGGNALRRHGVFFTEQPRQRIGAFHAGQFAEPRPRGRVSWRRLGKAVEEARDVEGRAPAYKRHPSPLPDLGGKGLRSFDKLPGIELVRGFRDVDEMMGKPSQKLRSGLCRADVHGAVDLHGIRIDHLEAIIHEGCKDGRLAHGRGSEKDHQGRRAPGAPGGLGEAHVCVSACSAITTFTPRISSSIFISRLIPWSVTRTSMSSIPPTNEAFVFPTFELSATMISCGA